MWKAQIAARLEDSMVVAAAIVGMILTSPASVFAQQCAITASTGDVSVAGSQRLQAATTQQDCVDRGTRVKAWISGGGAQCLTGQVDGSGCGDSSTSGNAVVTVGRQQCGVADGYSDHWGLTPFAVVELSRNTTLNAGDCADQCSAATDMASCAALEPQCQWGGSTCIFAPGSPIIIATDKNAKYDLTSAADGVIFDIDGDGIPEQIAWTKVDSPMAFLALDRDGDGRITE